VRLTAPVRAVLRVLADNHGSRMPVATIARESRLSSSAVRVVLAGLGKARLVRHALAPGFDRTPPRTVYWLTGDGVAVATDQPPAASGRAGTAR
jgi:hypothetical protein